MLPVPVRNIPYTQSYGSGSRSRSIQEKKSERETEKDIYIHKDSERYIRPTYIENQTQRKRNGETERGRAEYREI